MSAPRGRATAWSAVTLFISLYAPQPAHAQAFVPAKGEGAVSVVFQDAAVKWHLLPTEHIDRGRIRTMASLVDFSIGLGRNVALSVALPYVTSRYNGSAPHLLLSNESVYHPSFVLQDDGKFHGTLQDLRVDLRYNVTRRGLVITPFIATILPSHDYEFFAHSAAGRNIREVQVGVFVARLLDPLIPGAFVQSRYSYGFAERVLDVPHNRSNLAFEAGYFVNPSLRMFVLGTGQVTHGGIDLTPAGRAVLGSERFIHHDQISKDHQVNLGAGAAFSLTDSVDVFGSVVKTVAGRNGHILARSLSLGVSFGFGRNPGGAGSIAAAAASVESERARSEADALLKCVCLKK